MLTRTLAILFIISGLLFAGCVTKKATFDQQSTTIEAKPETPVDLVAKYRLPSSKKKTRYCNYSIIVDEYAKDVDSKFPGSVWKYLDQIIYLNCGGDYSSYGIYRVVVDDKRCFPPKNARNKWLKYRGSDMMLNGPPEVRYLAGKCIFREINDVIVVEASPSLNRIVKYKSYEGIDPEDFIRSGIIPRSK